MTKLALRSRDIKWVKNTLENLHKIQPEIIERRWLIGSCIGTRMFGIVYKALDLETTTVRQWLSRKNEKRQRVLHLSTNYRLCREIQSRQKIAETNTATYFGEQGRGKILVVGSLGISLDKACSDDWPICCVRV